MDDQMIITLIEKTLKEKMSVDPNYIKYTFYELRVKHDLSEYDSNRFLELLKIKLQNGNYKVYYTGDSFRYKNEFIMVKDNELVIAVKQKKEN